MKVVPIKAIVEYLGPATRGSPEHITSSEQVEIVHARETQVAAEILNALHIEQPQILAPMLAQINNLAADGFNYFEAQLLHPTPSAAAEGRLSYIDSAVRLISQRYMGELSWEAMAAQHRTNASRIKKSTRIAMSLLAHTLLGVASPIETYIGVDLPRSLPVVDAKPNAPEMGLVSPAALAGTDEWTLVEKAVLLSLSAALAKEELVSGSQLGKLLAFYAANLGLVADSHTVGLDIAGDKARIWQHFRISLRQIQAAYLQTMQTKDIGALVGVLEELTTIFERPLPRVNHAKQIVRPSNINSHKRIKKPKQVVTPEPTFDEKSKWRYYFPDTKGADIDRAVRDITNQGDPEKSLAVELLARHWGLNQSRATIEDLLQEEFFLSGRKLTPTGIITLLRKGRILVFNATKKSSG